MTDEAKLTIYRILCVPNVDAMIDVDRLPGQSWTTDFSELSVDALHADNDAGNDWVDVILVADIASDDIDWKKTNALRTDLPWEWEIALLPHARLDGLRIHRFRRSDLEIGSMIRKVAMSDSPNP